jgi:D-alanyl-lipoteichoic acid acyltransferase DltB (MBOAT superfamily)
MLFNSIEFIVFFIAVTGLYFLLPHKYRWSLLLTASCFFYMFFKPVYILILGFTIVIDYFAGIMLENQTDQKKKKQFLIMSLVANIGVLAVFKYFNFLNDNITGIAQFFGYKNQIPYLNILLPIGLSFHTFQAMSYTIEVYRGHQKAERHFGIYSLYVMFYPQLVAGPIERPQNMLHQFHEEKFFNYHDTVTGLRLMLWGMFKKVVIADRLAVVTDMVFNDPYNHSAVSIAICSAFFAFQIFCDFSGYSDIAIGSARIMGIKLMRNFDRPHSALSISEFWSRWHISLSTWFKDYLYIPLGGNRVPPVRRQFNLFIVFFMSGLWHGADWRFIIWGSLHGVYLVFANLTKDIRYRIRQVIGLTRLKWLDNSIQRTITFSLVAIALIFFRSNHLRDATYMIGRLPDVFGEIGGMIRKGAFNSGLHLESYKLAMCVLAIGLMEAVHFMQRDKAISVVFDQQPRYLRWGVYYVTVFAIIYLGVFTNREFIYFQF